MSRLALTLAAVVAVLPAAAPAQQTVLPPEISLTNAMDPALRRAIETGDLAEVAANGGTAPQMLAAGLRSSRARMFEDLAAKLTESPNRRLEFVVHDGASGLAVMDGRLVVHAITPGAGVLGPPPPGAAPLDLTGLRAGGRTLITLSGRRLQDDPAPTAPPAPAAGDGLPSINLRTTTFTRDPCPEGQRLMPAGQGRVAFCTAA